MKEEKIVKMYKSGNFYNVFGNGAIIIHGLHNYKFVESKNGVGFSTNALAKVKASLEENHISYIVYERDEEVAKYKGVDKDYDRLLSDGLKRYSMNVRLDRLQSKIEKMSLEKLEKLVEAIENESIGE